MMFEIYKEKIEINGENYEIRPLSGRFLPKLYSVMAKFEGAKEGESISIGALDEDTMSKLHLLSFESFKKSYPDKKEDELEEFVSQNLLKIMEGLIKVNVKAE